MTKYEMVIGLEVHVELATRTKLFCSCENRFGAPPNTLVCPVCMGLPGTLPALNGHALTLAATAGLALGCTVHPLSRFDRKNYFYPDLPKAYQITQFYHPLCEGGSLTIRTEAGQKRVGITRIHVEEDAGKLTHGEHATLLDLNRCGVPLIEIVSEPDLRSPEEASAYLRKLRAVLVYAGVSDCRMNEGSMRCDVNLSIRRPGEPMGTRTEMKNLNSFQSVERAIRAEYARQAAVLDEGGVILQETRRYDQKSGKTLPMRRKEDSADYRYFPEPDIPWVRLPHDVEALRAALPMLPDERRARLMQRFGLSDYAAEQLTADKHLCDRYEAAAEQAQDPVTLCNLVLGEAFAQMTARGLDHLPVAPAHMAALSDLISSGKVNSTTGKKILSAMFDADCDPVSYAQANDLFALTDAQALRAAARDAIAQNAGMVTAYRAGKQNVAQALMGRAMALTRGRADAQLLRDILMQELNAQE